MKHTLNYKAPPGYSTYKNRHRAKGFANACVISESDFKKHSLEKCHYCGVAGTSGIDRIDCTKGYEKNNCVPCCKHCNYVKGNLSVSDFETWAKRFVSHQAGKTVEQVAARAELNSGRENRGDTSCNMSTLPRG